MARIDREDLIPLVAGVLFILAMATVAASITSPTILTDAGQGGGTNQPGLLPNPAGNGSGPQGPIEQGNESTGDTIIIEMCIDPLTTAPGTFGYAAAILGLFYLVYRQWSASVAFLSAYGVLPVVTLAYFLMTAGCVTGSDARQPGDSGGIAATIQETPVAPESTPIAIAVILGVVLIGAVVLIYTSIAEDEIDELTKPDKSTDDVDMDALADAASRAADRLEKANADVDNEVYEAWKEMTSLLYMDNPETSTPGEFAKVAIDAGLGQDNVNELTTLFEEVRYGHRDPTGEREERAIDVFRAIEAEHGGEGDDPGENGGETQ